MAAKTLEEIMAESQSLVQPSQAPGTLPPEVEEIVRGMGQGTPQVTGMAGRFPRFTIPPNQDQVRRELLMEKAKKRLADSEKPAAKVPSGQLTVLNNTEKAMTILQDIIQDMEKNQYRTGPLSPRFYKTNVGNAAMQYFGTTKESDFKKKVSDYANAYANAQTGAQRGFKEIQWLNAAIPETFQDVPDKFLSAAKSSMERLRDNRENMRTLLGESGYQVDGGTSASGPLDAEEQSIVDDLLR